MPDLREVIGWLAAMATVAAVAVPVVVAARVTTRGRPWWPPQRFRAVPWDGAACLAAAVIFVGIPALTSAALGPLPWDRWMAADDPVRQPIMALIVALVSLPFQLFAWWLALFAIGGVRPPRLFGTPRRWLREGALGAAAWLVFAPAVYGLNLAVLLVYSLAYGSQPPDHPLIQLLRDQHGVTLLVWLVLAESVIAAPVREEVFFRGILQPWLCRHPQAGAVGLGWAAAVGAASRSMATPAPAGWSALAPPILLALALVPLAVWLDAKASQPVPPTWLCRLVPLTNSDTRRRAVLGLLSTAAIFANLHARVWPTPIPLFLLALALGWLALRTQGIAAAVVLHALFNAVACLEMLLLPGPR